MAEHQASVRVQAPVEQVYELFTHFNDYPKFMSHVKEVTYYDQERSHWVVDIVGRHEWDAVNENWIKGQQVGWRSTDGLQNSGRVTFSATGDNQTLLTVLIGYNPPAGVLGEIGESLGAGKAFEKALNRDLMHFARMVQEAPPGALDPQSSNYLFHSESAAARGTTTRAQDETMEGDIGGAAGGSVSAMGSQTASAPSTGSVSRSTGDVARGGDRGQTVDTSVGDLATGTSMGVGVGSGLGDVTNRVAPGVSGSGRSLRDDIDRGNPRATAPLRDDVDDDAEAEQRAGDVRSGYENTDVNVTNPDLNASSFGDPKI